MTQTKTIYQSELETTTTLVKSLRDTILDYYYQDLKVETKSNDTPVTIADKQTNKAILEHLHQEFPLDTIISEEDTDILGTNNRAWYIDPIDGTRGFINGTDDFAIHIGLVQDQKPVFGMVYKIVADVLYSGATDLPATRTLPNGQIQPLRTKEFESEIPTIVTSKRVFNKSYFEALKTTFPQAKYLATGSAGLRLMMIAEGRGDFHIEHTNTWDLCGPQAILEAAGGSVSYLDGSSVTYHGQRELKMPHIAAKDNALLHRYGAQLHRAFQ